MDLSVSGKRIAHALGGLLALTACAGSMHATVLSSSATATLSLTAPSVTCNTLTGVPASGQTITVHAFPAPTGTNTYTVGVVQIAGLKITPPAAVILSSTTNAAGLVFTVNSLPGCQGLSTASGGVNSITPQFTTQANVGQGSQGSVLNDVTATVTATLTATTSAITAANVTVTCAYNSVGPYYQPGAPQYVSVTSAANGGTPFLVTNSSLPSWLQLGPAAPGGTATNIATNFTVSATSGCGAFAGVQQTYSLPLTSAPAPPVNITITLNASSKSPLTVTPVPAAPSISLSYIKNSEVAAVANVNVTSTVPSVYFIVDTATLPVWLTVNITGAVIPTGGKALQFTTTTAADSLAPGTYSATVFLSISGDGDYAIPITLLVNNAPAKLVITSANPMPVAYTLGGPVPVTTITLASTDSPIPYSIALGGILAPQLTSGEQLTGIAYSFGTNIAITYNPLLFQTSAPGTVISGTVTVTWGSPASETVIAINLTVGSPAASLTSISPATLPTTSVVGTSYFVTLTGAGFVGGSNPALATRVGVVSGTPPGILTTDTNITVSSVIDPSHLSVKIVVPATADPNLPFAVGGSGGPVYIGVVNGTATIPTGTQTLTIGGQPIIYGVTSSSSFNEVSNGALPQIAPYDMISIFGANFCSAGVISTNCSTNTILLGAPDTVTYRYPFFLSPDGAAPVAPAVDTRRQVTVTFFVHGQTTGGLAAPLLFATNGQINAIVPGAVVTTANAEYDVVVGFGCPLLSGTVGCATSTVAGSLPFPVNTVPTDPGIFTVGSDGQGQAAALAAGTYALVTSSNPAGMRTGAASDTIQVYVTGLGIPPGTAAYTSNSGACVTPLGTGYLGAITAANPVSLSGLSNIDGFVLQDGLFTGDLPPCFASEPTATVGGVSATINYAAFVGDTVAGLYQINLVLPSATNTFDPAYPSTTGAITNVTAPTQLPLFVTAGGITTQAGVMIPVAPKLSMVVTSPAFSYGTTFVLPIGVPMTQTVITGSNNGSHTGVTYAVTSGVLPKGLALTQSGAGQGYINGTPLQGSAGTYQVTITGSDSSTPPISDTVTYTYYIPGAIELTGVAGGASVFATANTNVETITPTWGTGPFSWAITTGSMPAGLTINATGATGIVATDITVPAGTYTITVGVTDSKGNTGVITFTFAVKLKVVIGTPGPTSLTGWVSGAALTTAVTTVTVSGGSGTYTFAVDVSSTGGSTGIPADLVFSPTSGAGPSTLEVGTAPASGTAMSVVIDVTDTGTYSTPGIAAPPVLMPTAIALTLN